MEKCLKKIFIKSVSFFPQDEVFCCPHKYKLFCTTVRPCPFKANAKFIFVPFDMFFVGDSTTDFSFQKRLSTPVVSSYSNPAICSTSPRLAHLRITGLIMPGLLSRKALLHVKFAF